MHVEGHQFGTSPQDWLKTWVPGRGADGKKLSIKQCSPFRASLQADPVGGFPHFHLHRRSTLSPHPSGGWAWL